jgi:hypothetical protein
MPDQPFVNLIDNQPPDWRSRVKGCIVHTANAVFIKAAPTVAQGPSDALGRAVVLDPDLWTTRFMPVVASQLIGEPNLTSAEVTDAELFSAVNAAWVKFLPQPTPAG